MCTRSLRIGAGGGGEAPLVRYRRDTAPLALLPPITAPFPSCTSACEALVWRYNTLLIATSVVARKFVSARRMTSTSLPVLTLAAVSRAAVQVVVRPLATVLLAGLLACIEPR